MSTAASDSTGGQASAGGRASGGGRASSPDSRRTGGQASGGGRASSPDSRRTGGQASGGGRAPPPYSPLQATVHRPRWWPLTPILMCAAAMALVHCAVYAGFRSPIRSRFDYAWSHIPGFSPHQHMLVRWDGIRYWQIAALGYRWKNVPVGNGNTSWFPAYPMLARLLHFVFRAPITALLPIISSLFAFASCVLLYYLTGELFPTATNAPAMAVAGFLLQPMAVFLFAAYTEPIFVALSLAFFLFWRRQRLLAAALCASVADLVRPTGIFLGATLFFCLLFANDRPLAARVGRACLYASIAAAGFALWALVLAVKTRDPLMMLHIESWNHVGLSWRHTLLALQINRPIMRVARGIVSARYAPRVTALENACILSTPLVVAWMWRGRDRLPGGMVLFSFLLWIVPFFSHSRLRYEGLGRYVLATIAPLWIFFGIKISRQPRWIQAAVLVASGAAMTAIAARFSQGYWTG